MQNTQKDLAAIIGGYISELRKDAGLTQQQLADELHIGKGSISHFEQGRATPPTNLLVTFADYFGVNIDYLVGNCKLNIKYSELNQPYYGQTTTDVLISRLLSLDKNDRKFILEVLKMVERAEKNSSPIK